MVNKPNETLVLLCAAVFSFFISSCATVEPLYTTPGPAGTQLLFARPFSVKCPHGVVSSLSLDMTVSAADRSLTGNPVVNYSVTVPNKAIAAADMISVQFIAAETVYYVTGQFLIFRKPDGSKSVSVRYTAALDADDFFALLHVRQPLQIQLSFSDGTAVLLDSSELNRRFDSLRLLLL